MSAGMEHSLNASPFQSLIESLPGMLYRYKDEQSRTITYASKGCFDLTGYLPEELLSTIDFEKIIYPEDYSLVKKHLGEIVISKAEQRFQYRIVCKNGSIKAVREVAHGIYSEFGKLLHIEAYIEVCDKQEDVQPFSTLLDVEYHKNGSEDYLKTLVEGISDTLLTIKEDGSCTFYKKGDALSSPAEKLSDFLPESIAEKFLDYTRQVIISSKSISYEYNLTDFTSIGSYEARFVYKNSNEAIALIRNITDIVKAKTANEFYESIINNVNIDIAVIDHHNRYMLISKSAVKDDATRQWLLGKTDFEYCVDRGKSLEIAESRTEMYNLVDELKKPIEWIEELTDDSGKKRYFVRTLKPLKGPNNEKYKVGYGVDITALKVVQNELLRREHLLSFSHKLAKVGYWVWYPINRRHEWSDGVFDILEEDKKEVSPSLYTYLKYIHPEDRDSFEQTIKISKNNSTSYSLEYRIVTKTGKIKYIKEQSSSKRSDSNSNEYLFGMVQDITEMKTSQDALAQSEEHFRAIAESSPIYIIEVCDKYLITYINNVGERNRESIIGIPVFEFILPEYRNLLKETLEKVSAFGTIENLQMQGFGNGLVIEWYDVSIGPVKSDTGQVSSIILLAQNVTDKKENEQERERLIKEINNRYNELMQFNYIVSHNLRSPIANILGMSYILTPSTPPDDMKQIFEYIMQSA
ncbi:MAG: PAS domain-containing protein, partial [Pyrinomonadaceae bacterium]|nr:PAS domain-containing protein [Sphingobacteriaceae bacterium]